MREGHPVEQRTREEPMATSATDIRMTRSSGVRMATIVDRVLVMLDSSSSVYCRSRPEQKTRSSCRNPAFNSPKSQCEWSEGEKVMQMEEWIALEKGLI